MKGGYVFLIITSCVVPALLPLITLVPVPGEDKDGNNDTRIETFRDVVFEFEARFIQTVYKINTNAVAYSPQSAMIMLLMMGFGAPPEIENNLQTAMKLDGLPFEDLVHSKSILYRGMSGLLHGYQSHERHDILGWSWNMTVNISNQCVEQDQFMKVLKLFNSTITNRKGKNRHIQTEVRELFNPELTKFHVHCVKRHKNSSGSNPKRSLVINKMRSGKLSSLDDTDFYELPHHEENHDVSIIFLKPNGAVGLKSIMEKFGSLRYTDFQNANVSRASLKMPIGKWTNYTRVSEFRPFFLEAIPSYRETRNRIKGNFDKVCALKVGKTHIYEIAGQVTLRFRTEENSTANLPKCDSDDELRKKSTTQFFTLDYPFIMMIVLDKSIIFFNVIHDDPK